MSISQANREKNKITLKIITLIIGTIIIVNVSDDMILINFNIIIYD